MRLSETAHLDTDILRREALFPDTMQSEFSDAQSPEKNYGVFSVNVHIAKIRTNMMSLSFLVASFAVTYIRYLKANMMMTKHGGVKPFLSELEGDAIAAKNHDLTHLDHPVLYNSSEEIVRLIIMAADAFVNNDRTAATFCDNCLYNHA